MDIEPDSSSMSRVLSKVDSRSGRISIFTDAGRSEQTRSSGSRSAINTRVSTTVRAIRHLPIDFLCECLWIKVSEAADHAPR